MKPPRFSADARREIRQALRWWKEHRDKNPKRLSKDLRRAYTLLTSAPLAVGALAPDVPPESGIRFMYLRRSRYLLYYSVHEDHVEVLRFWQSSQDGRPFSE